MKSLKNITPDDLQYTRLMSPTEIAEGMIGITQSYMKSYTGLSVYKLNRLARGEKVNSTIDSIRKISYFLKHFRGWS